MLSALRGVGWYLAGGAGPVPLTATELLAWLQGTEAVLGPVDFQDVLNASRAFVFALNEFDGVNVPCPWTPPAKPLTPEEEAAVIAAEHALWDRVMGLDKDNV